MTLLIADNIFILSNLFERIFANNMIKMVLDVRNVFFSILLMIKFMVCLFVLQVDFKVFNILFCDGLIV